MEIRGIMGIFGNNSIILLTGYHSKLIKRKKHPPNTVTFLNKTAGNKLDLPALLCADMVGFVFGMIETIKRRL